jgi:3-hydroxyacyl-CoA dehydrogenase
MTSNQIRQPDIGEVAVVGLGIMGSGIAEVLARSGHNVTVIDTGRDALAGRVRRT